MDLDLGTQARRAAQTAGGGHQLPAPLFSGAPAESPAAAPAQRMPGSAQGGPAVPTSLAPGPGGPGPLGAVGAGGLGAPLPPTQKLPHVRGPKPQVWRAERGPQQGSRAW